jgi:hypothetical protein
MAKRQFQLSDEQMRALTRAHDECKDCPTRSHYLSVRLYGSRHHSYSVHHFLHEILLFGVNDGAIFIPGHQYFSSQQFGSLLIEDTGPISLLHNFRYSTSNSHNDPTSICLIH